MGTTTRLYIGNLHRDTREYDLERYFSAFGHIRDCVVKQGFGFVEPPSHPSSYPPPYYRDDRDRDRDRDRRSPPPLLPPRRRERRGPVRPFGRSSRTKHRAIVENISSAISWQDLKDFFRAVADVTYADAHTPRKYEGRSGSGGDQTRKRTRRSTGSKSKSRSASNREGSKSPAQNGRKSGSGASGAEGKSRSQSKSRSASRSGTPGTPGSRTSSR